MHFFANPAVMLEYREDVPLFRFVLRHDDDQPVLDFNLTAAEPQRTTGDRIRPADLKLT